MSWTYATASRSGLVIIATFQGFPPWVVTPRVVWGRERANEREKEKGEGGNNLLLVGTDSFEFSVTSECFLIAFLWVLHTQLSTAFISDACFLLPYMVKNLFLTWHQLFVYYYPWKKSECDRYYYAYCLFWVILLKWTTLLILLPRLFKL